MVRMITRLVVSESESKSDDNINRAATIILTVSATVMLTVTAQ
jgi:hypothetical protein